MQYILENRISLGGATILGFTVGILTGLFGAGGGFIITPALNIFLGLPMNLAVGTSACQVFGAAGFTCRHSFKKHAKIFGGKIAFAIGVGLPIGVYLGTQVVTKLANRNTIVLLGKQLAYVDVVLLSSFAVLLVAIAIWMLVDYYYLRVHHTEEHEASHIGLLTHVQIPPYIDCETLGKHTISIPLLIGIGLCMGFLSGLLGIGGGVIMFPLLHYIIGQQSKYAVKTSVLLVLLSGLFAVLFHAFDQNIDRYMALFLLPGAFFGSRVGVMIHHRMSSKNLRKYFAFVVLGAALMVIAKLGTMLF